MDTWTSPLDRARYDDRPELTPQERDDLAALAARRLFRQATEREHMVERLYTPVKEALVYCRASAHQLTITWGAFIEHILPI